MTKYSKTSCCPWDDFLDDYLNALDHDPTGKELKQADKDWRAMNTGWEAAQIAMEPPEEEYEVEHIVGRHYRIKVP